MKDKLGKKASKQANKQIKKPAAESASRECQPSHCISRLGPWEEISHCHVTCYSLKSWHCSCWCSATMSLVAPGLLQGSVGHSGHSWRQLCCLLVSPCTSSFPVAYRVSRGISLAPLVFQPLSLALGWHKGIRVWTEAVSGSMYVGVLRRNRGEGCHDVLHLKGKYSNNEAMWEQKVGRTGETKWFSWHMIRCGKKLRDFKRLPSI